MDKKLRHQIYVKALYIYINDDSEGNKYYGKVGLCATLRGAIRELKLDVHATPSPYSEMHRYPEISKHENESAADGYWWHHTCTEIRISILKQAIEDTL